MLGLMCCGGRPPPPPPLTYTLIRPPSQSFFPGPLVIVYHLYLLVAKLLGRTVPLKPKSVNFGLISRGTTR